MLYLIVLEFKGSEISSTTINVPLSFTAIPPCTWYQNAAWIGSMSCGVSNFPRHIHAFTIAHDFPSDNVQHIPSREKNLIFFTICDLIDLVTVTLLLQLGVCLPFAQVKIVSTCETFLGQDKNLDPGHGWWSMVIP